MRLEEVFKINGVPTVTFVEPPDFARILVNLRTPGRGLLIEGPSGIGKTTVVTQALSQLDSKLKALVLSARKAEDVKLIQSLPHMGDLGLVVVDDFHRLQPADQRQVADLMKVIADAEDASSKVIVVGINDAGRTLIHFAPDLVNRIDTIKIEASTKLADRVERLLELGEEALNIELGIRSDLVAAAAGSYYLAQLLAYEACLKAKCLERQENKTRLAVSFEDVRREVLDRLKRSFDQPVRVFASGTRVRREGRAPYLHLLKWLSEIDGFSLDIGTAIQSQPSMAGSVGQIVEKGYVGKLINGNDQLLRCLHFQEQANMLSAEDPQFMFFLRNIPWATFAKELGFASLTFEGRYDVALSFAGEDRPIAEALFAELSERELEVFYDKNEQHRIAGNDLEEYLAPIYASEASYVVVLVSSSYPKKIWTKFESDQFSARMGTGAVIPVWFEGERAPPWDKSANLGALTLRPSADLAEQVAALADTLCRKLAEQRSKQTELFL
jgi:TIR domain/ATPase family associated with various cellular activities (AAA)